MQPNTPEWHKFRAGKFTASKVHKLMGEAKGIKTATAQTYIIEKVAEELAGPSLSLETAATRWGHDHEDDARMYYEIAFGVKVRKPAPKSPRWSKHIAASPDGIVLPGKNLGRRGVEFKCPFNPSNHVLHMLIRSADDLKSTSKEYYWQIQMCMLVWNIQAWDFVSYDPRFTGRNRMHVVEISASPSDQLLLRERLLEAIAQKKQILSAINTKS